MSDESFEPLLAASDAARQYLRRATDQAIARASQASQLQDSIMQTSVSVWSPGKEVRVTLAPNGLLLDVQYATRASTVEPAALAALTLRTLRLAMAELQDRVDALTVEEGSVAESIRTAYHDSFAGPLSKLEPRTHLTID